MSIVDVTNADLAAPANFAAELERMITPLQVAFKKLIIEWGSPLTAAELDRLSGAGAKVCWQVFRVANATDAIAEARNVPSPSSLKRLLSTAALAGVSSQAIDAVESEGRKFKVFSKRAASDRAAFDSMVAGAVSNETVERDHLTQRRAAYRAMSYLEGIQADLLYLSTMVRKSTAGDFVNSEQFMVQRGLRRLRPEAQVTLFGYHRNPNEVEGVVEAEDPIDTDAAELYGMPVLPQFSTQPLPNVEKISLSSGFDVFNASRTEIGTRGNFDLTIGRHIRETPYMVDTDGRKLIHLTFSHIRKPVAMLIQELIVHRPSFPNVRPEYMAYKYVEGFHLQDAVRRLQRYPLDERLSFLGRADAVGLADIPRYSDLLRLGADKSGCDLGEYDIYRLRVQYPIMYSATRIFAYLT